MSSGVDALRRRRTVPSASAGESARVRAVPYDLVIDDGTALTEGALDDWNIWPALTDPRRAGIRRRCVRSPSGVCLFVGDEEVRV